MSLFGKVGAAINARVARQERLNEKLTISSEHVKVAGVACGILTGLTIASVGIALAKGIVALAAGAVGGALLYVAVAALALVVLHDLVKIIIEAARTYQKNGSISLSGRFMFEQLWIGKGLDKVLSHFGQ